MSQATDAGKSRILTLQIKDPVMKQVIREATDNMAKGQIFYETFFPLRNLATTPVPQDFQYPPPRWKFQNIFVRRQYHHWPFLDVAVPPRVFPGLLLVLQ